MRAFLKENDMIAYLAMMALRLVELRRVLKPTGRLYLHCDPTASHYLKLLMDAAFDPSLLRERDCVEEVRRAQLTARQGSKHYGRVHHVMLFYSKSDERRFSLNICSRRLPQSTVIDNGHRNVEASVRG